MIHPDYLLPALTSRQYAEWMAFYSRSSFGQEATERMIARVGAALWNQQRGKNTDPLSEDDFLPKPLETLNVEQIKQRLRMHLP